MRAECCCRFAQSPRIISLVSLLREWRNQRLLVGRSDLLGLSSGTWSKAYSSRAGFGCWRWGCRRWFRGSSCTLSLCGWIPRFLSSAWVWSSCRGLSFLWCSCSFRGSFISELWKALLILLGCRISLQSCLWLRPSWWLRVLLEPQFLP